MKHLTFILLLAMTYSLAKAQQDDRGYIVKVGEKAPNIELLFPDGTKKQLKDLKGKVIMIQFTASWCGVCRKEMPFIEKDIWLKYKNNPEFALFGIDFKESKETTEKFAKDIKITYPLLLDPEGKAFYTYAAQGAGVTRNIFLVVHFLIKHRGGKKKKKKPARKPVKKPGLSKKSIKKNYPH